MPSTQGADTLAEGVMNACATLAGISVIELDVSSEGYIPLPEACVEAVRRARTQACAEDLPDVQAGLVVFDSLAWRLNGRLTAYTRHLISTSVGRAWRGLDDSLERCGGRKAEEEVTAPEPSVEGQALGRVLAWLQRTERHDEALAIARRVLWRPVGEDADDGEARRLADDRADSVAAILAQAVQVPGAGPLATLGFLASSDEDDWSAVTRDTLAVDAETLAWLVGGLRLRACESVRDALMRSDLWIAPGVFDTFVEAVARRVRDWDEETVQRFRAAQCSVASEVWAFNEGFGGAQDAGGWLPVRDSGRMASRVESAIEAHLGMAAAARRLDGHHDEARQVRRRLA